MCIGGRRGKGGVARTHECEHLVSDKNLQFTFSQAIRRVSPSVPYVSRSPRPPLPWGAEGVGFLLSPPRWGVYQ